METITGSDGLTRCPWSGDDPLYVRYHDEEWGRATTDDRTLFEKICLEGFQAGLSWITILRKRPAFRKAFDGFDIAGVSQFGDDEVERLRSDPAIIRHEGKIRATINNAVRAEELIEESGSLAGYLWEYADPAATPPDPNVTMTDTSRALSSDLKRRGWKFVGPTTMYAFMQAMGLVNDHLDACHVRGECEELRQSVLGG